MSKPRVWMRKSDGHLGVLGYYDFIMSWQYDHGSCLQGFNPADFIDLGEL